MEVLNFRVLHVHVTRDNWWSRWFGHAYEYYRVESHESGQWVPIGNYDNAAEAMDELRRQIFATAFLVELEFRPFLAMEDCEI